MSELKIYPDPAALTRATADQFVGCAHTAIASTGKFSVALSGGSTPKALFALLASPEFATQVEWKNIHLFWGDERCVPPDDKDSNYLMTRQTLLDHVPIPAENVNRIMGELEPEQAAADYVKVLETYFGKKSTPRFDLIFLGMGDDGHTASLFPGTAAIHENSKWVIAHYVEKVKMWRITLTPAVINAAANVSFLVTGKDKSERLAAVLKGPYQPDVLPSQIVKPTEGKLLWMVDSGAAALI